MKQILAFFVAVLLSALLVSAASAATVYVNDGGSGDGSSASAPLGDMSAAIEKVANGGTVVITDAYTLTDEYYEPAHKGEVVVTGGKIVFNAEKYNRWYLGGPTTFENVTMDNPPAIGLVIVAQFNKVVIGEGIVTPLDKCYVVGGYQVPFADGFRLDLNSDVTIKSGTWRCVCGSSRGKSSQIFEGTAKIRMDGGTVNMLCGGAINGSAMNNSVIDINGGTITTLMAAGDATRRLNGNSTITVNGGSIGTLQLLNVMGKAVVNYNGGSIGFVEEGLHSDLQARVEAGEEGLKYDGESTLNVNANIKAAALALAFDNVNYVSGGAPVAETTKATTKAAETPVATAPVETVAATEAAEAPEETAAPETTGAEKTADAAETTDAVEKETVKETEAAAEVAADAAAETANAPSGDSDAKEGGSAPVALIVCAVCAVAVIAAVVVILVKKKKK